MVFIRKGGVIEADWHLYVTILSPTEARVLGLPQVVSHPFYAGTCSRGRSLFQTISFVVSEERQFTCGWSGLAFDCFAGF